MTSGEVRGRWRAAWPALLLIAALAIWRVCGAKPAAARICGTAMCMNYAITLGESQVPNALELTGQIARQTFHEVDQHLNRWNSDSELSRLNRLAPGTPFPLSPLLHQMLQIADRVVHTTQGRFDPTVEPACRLWRESLQGDKVPSSAKLRELRERTGWRHLRFETGGGVCKLANVELDLGGIAKGYCVDLIAQRLQRAGLENFFVDWGGEVCARGQHPSGRRWTIGICKPNQGSERNVESLIQTLQVGDAALATSGSDRQFWVVSGPRDAKIRYSHIVDPRSLKALAGNDDRPTTCCVLSSTCALADGLATAGMLFESAQEASCWFSALDIQECGIAWIVSPKETIRIPFGQSS